MTRLNLVLLLRVIASALVMVKSAYDSRRLFNEIFRAEQEAKHLAGEHQRLEADRQLQATNLRVERTARERLKMATVTPAITMYEDRPAAPSPAASAASAALINPAAPLLSPRSVGASR